MNKVEEQIFQAIDILFDKRASELAYDKTIQARIYSIVDLDTGEYKARYNGNIFSVFSDDKTKTYKVDEDVYVIVPEGDFSNRKLITSSVSSQSLSYGQLQQLQNTVVSVSPSMTDVYQGVKAPPYQVVAGAEVTSAHGQDWIYQGSPSYNPEDFHGLFQQYASQYDTIRIAASFLTQFHSIHTQGNYGIEIEFYTRDNVVASYKLDVNQFNGDPYNFTSTYSRQYVVIKVPLNYLIGLKSIRLFQENFIPDHLIENGVVTDKENLTQPNIFAKDLAIDFVEIHDLTDTTYYLNISTPQGIAFINNISSIDLVGRLIYQDKDLMSEKTCTCQWYERDLSIMIGADGYDRNAGFGWKKLETAATTLHLTNTDVACRQRYKLIVIYNKKITLSAEVEIYNQRNGYDIAIAQLTEGEDISLRLTDSALVGDWYMSFPDGAYLQLDTAGRRNSVIVTPYLQYSTVTFYCSVYTQDGLYLGSLEYVINSADTDDAITVSYIGEDTFRYDANGDVTIDEAERDRTLQVQLVWAEGQGTSYNLEWFMGENAIPKSRDLAISPTNSMVDQVWVDNYNVLHYNIKQKYKVNYNNNTLTLKVNTIFGETYTFQKEILFLKDGDQGTNGTTYVAVIRPCDEDGLKLNGLHPLVFQDRWLNELPLRTYVYNDGELINNDKTNYSIDYKWTGINIDIKTTDDGSKIHAAGQGNNPPPTYELYVKVQVTITDRQHNNKKVVIYTSYPIDLAINGIDYSKIDISEIPSYIKYNTSGLTPQFYRRSLNYIYDGQSYNNLIASLNTNILTLKTDKDGNVSLSPAAQFIFEEIKNKSDSNIGVLELRDPSSEVRRLVHPIIMYLDTYGNEQINGWDGTAIEVNEEEHYVFAPQVGAGTKDSANRFTGVVMGKDSGQDMIGLYGYQSGVNTFGLMQNGRAFFGASSGGGRIWIDGTTAELYGGDGGDSETGMTIHLANLHPEKKSDAIKIGGGVFRVTYDGALEATSANILGTIYARAGQIGCDENRRGGWTIQANRLFSGTSSNYVALDSSNGQYAIWAGRTNPGDSYTPTTSTFEGTIIGNIENPAPFVVTRDGFLYCTNAKIKGYIDSSQGQIGGWKIDRTKLYNDSGVPIGMAATGNAAFWVGDNLSNDSINDNGLNTSTYFLVTRQGRLYCKSATIRGRIEADSGNIGDWEIGSSGLSYAKDSSVYLSPYGLSMGDNFYVSSTGILTCKNANLTGSITAERGKIGDWILNSYGLASSDGTISLYPSGIRVGDDFSVTSYGYLTCSNANLTGKITASSGKIGNWTISEGALTNSFTTLKSNGDIDAKNLAVYQVNIKKVFSYWGETYGFLGMLEGSDDYGTTENIGLQSSSNKTSIILQSKRNIGMRTYIPGTDVPNGGIYIHSLTMHVSVRNIYFDETPTIDLPLSAFSGYSTITTLQTNYTTLEARVSALEKK